MRVLVCNVGEGLGDEFQTDVAVYRKYYPAVTEQTVRRKSELVFALESGFELVHLFSRCSPEGILTDLEDATVDGSELIRLCTGYRTRLLWIAASNPSSSYIKGFRVNGSPLNLIMTLNRKGDRFDDFLDKLLSSVSSGKPLPAAWAAISPQKGGPPTSELPECIFYAPGPPLSLPR